jgi:hypothetical protein
MLNGADFAVRHPFEFWLRTGTAAWKAQFACWELVKTTCSIWS